jgi:hypothetical protein
LEFNAGMTKPDIWTPVPGTLAARHLEKQIETGAKAGVPANQRKPKDNPNESSSPSQASEKARVSTVRRAQAPAVFRKGQLAKCLQLSGVAGAIRRKESLLLFPVFLSEAKDGTPIRRSGTVVRV